MTNEKLGKQLYWKWLVIRAFFKSLCISQLHVLMQFHVTENDIKDTLSFCNKDKNFNIIN